jgi:hypothetical protein
MSSRPRGELTSAEIDRRWPHQVAVPGNVVRQRYSEIEVAKVALDAAPRGHSGFHDNTSYHVYCFADPEERGKIPGAVWRRAVQPQGSPARG